MDGQSLGEGEGEGEGEDVVLLWKTAIDDATDDTSFENIQQLWELGCNIILLGNMTATNMFSNWSVQISKGPVSLFTIVSL